MIAWGLDMTASYGENGLLPLHLACQFSCPVVIHLLLNHGADPCAKDSLGHTPLYYLFGHKNKQMEQKLKRYQIHFKWTCNKTEDGPILVNSSKIAGELKGLPTKEFQNLLNDGINEIERRLSQRSPLAQSPTTNDTKSNMKLGTLGDVDFRKLCDRIFDELNLREYRKMNCEMNKAFLRRDSINLSPSNDSKILAHL